MLAESIKNEYQNIYYLRDRNWDFLDSPNYSLKNFNFMKHIQILPPKFILKDFGNDVYLDYKINSDNSIESVDSTYHNGKIFTEKDFELTKRYNPSINDYELLADYGKIWNSGYELLKINVY